MRPLFLPFAVALAAISCLAQASPNPVPGDPQPSLRVQTEVTLVDVVVRAHGHGSAAPAGMTRNNFQLSENGVRQQLLSVEEHVPPTTPHAPMPKLPSGTYTNYRPPEAGNTAILLLDALNTPRKDQMYVRRELLSFVKQVPAGADVAIFTLGSQLRLLQPFSTDRAALLAAINRPQANPVGSDLLPGDLATAQKASDQAQESEDSAGIPPSPDSAPDLAANLRQFEAEQDTFDYSFRVRLTLAALSGIADYVRGTPGRKNLIWVSGSFPAAILPNAQLGNAEFDASSYLGSLVQKTTSLLTDARISVYPVDATGLATLTSYDAGSEQASRYLSRSTHPLQTQDMKQMQTLDANHSSLTEVAEQTGGRAFFNTNGIAEAIASAVSEGERYYTLAYRSSDRNPAHLLRRISIKVSPGSYDLNYRRAYFAALPGRHTGGNGVSSDASGVAAAFDPVHAAFQAGAPDSTGILFDVSVQHKSNGAEQKEAQTPIADWKGAVAQYTVDYAVSGRDLHPEIGDDGKSHLALEFAALVYDDAGHVLNSTSQHVALDMTEAQALHLAQTGFAFHQEIALPQKLVFLRVGVADRAAGRTGTLEIAMPPAR